MKRILLGLSCFSFFILTGCSSGPRYKTEYSANVTKDSKLIDVKADSDYNSATLFIKNLTDDVIEVDWNSSSIGGSSLFFSGQKFVDAGKQVPSTAIPPKGTINKTIYKADEIYYSNGWRIEALKYPTSIVLKILNNGKSEYEVINLDKTTTLIEPQIKK